VTLTDRENLSHCHQIRLRQRKPAFIAVELRADNNVVGAGGVIDTEGRAAAVDGDEGLLFVGDHGKILCAFNGAHPKLIPQSRMDSYQQPPKTLPRSPGNEREWLDACKGSKVKPGGNFEFEGMVTETLLLGNVATQAGQKLTWDRSSMRVNNSGLAQNQIHPERRKGWEL